MNDTPYHDRFGGKHNELFRPAADGTLNACVGRNGGPADLYRYARGFFEAGRTLVEGIRREPLGIDTGIYPLVHVFRHGIEVYIKHLARVLPLVCERDVKVGLSHKLLDNWSAVKACLKQLTTADEGAEAIRAAERTLRDFVSIDPNGECFRYPEARDGTPHLQDTSLISIEVFGSKMAELWRLFETWAFMADGLYQKLCEITSYQQEMALEYEHYLGLTYGDDPDEY